MFRRRTPMYRVVWICAGLLFSAAVTSALSQEKQAATPDEDWKSLRGKWLIGKAPKGWVKLEIEFYIAVDKSRAIKFRAFDKETSYGYHGAAELKEEKGQR